MPQIVTRSGRCHFDAEAEIVFNLLEARVAVEHHLYLRYGTFQLNTIAARILVEKKFSARQDSNQRLSPNRG